MKIAVVGCNRGIGLALASQLNTSENEVYGFCRTSSPELKSLKLSQVVEGFEVTNSAKMKDLLNEFKGSKFDWLIHVSGVLKSESLDDLNEETILEQFKINSLGPLITVKAFKPYLNNPSKVGLIASRMGSVEDNSSGGMYGYRMSKSALNSAGRSLAMDLQSDNISVYLLHPGYVKTDMTSGNGLIDTKESAEGLIQIMKTKSIEHTGSFWHTNQEPLPW